MQIPAAGVYIYVRDSNNRKSVRLHCRRYGHRWHEAEACTLLLIVVCRKNIFWLMCARVMDARPPFRLHALCLSRRARIYGTIAILIRAGIRLIPTTWRTCCPPVTNFFDHIQLVLFREVQPLFVGIFSSKFSTCTVECGCCSAASIILLQKLPKLLVNFG